MDQKRLKISDAELLARAREIKLLAMDVDGVLTNGDVLVLESGEELKVFNAKDRLIMACMRDLKVPVRIAWITGRSSNAVSISAKDLGVEDLVMKCHDKRAALESILSKHKLSFNQAAYIGDDLIDLEVMRAVGFSACPSDSVSDVLERTQYVSPVAGGRGVARDVIEFILKAQGRWDGVLSSFLR